MSRKHYEAIAAEYGKALGEMWGQSDTPDDPTNIIHTKAAEQMWWAMVNGFCEVAKADNPAFDAERFANAAYMAAKSVAKV